MDISSDSVLGLIVGGDAKQSQPAAVQRTTPAPKVQVATSVRITHLTVVILPFIGFIAAFILLWGWGFSWLHLGLLAGMYLVSGLGITIGFHRYFTHKSFETPKFVQAILAIAGSMAVEGPVFRWAAQHRMHHQHSDDHDDPHSPHQHGDDFKGMMKGLWHSHVGWLFTKETASWQRYIPDLMSSKLLTTISNLFPLWVILGALIPTVLGGLLTMSWMGALFGFIWGGLARIFLVHHVTWSINSVCHVWGAQPYRSHDESRNNVIFGIMGMGEGWHNNHHAFPTSARHGLAWWQFDLSYCIIKVMQWVGLAWQVRTPSAASLAAKRNT